MKIKYIAYDVCGNTWLETTNKKEFDRRLINLQMDFKMPDGFLRIKTILI